MRTFGRSVVVATVAGLLALAGGGSAPAQEVGGVTADEQIRRNTRELLKAIAPGQWEVWDRLLDERVIYAAEDGRVLTKSDLEKEFKPLPPGYSGTLLPGSFVIRIHGDTAISTHEDAETMKIFGQSLTARYHTTDTWIRRDDAWRLVASQVLALPDDPPAVAIEPRVLSNYVGLYRLAPSVEYRVSLEGGVLFGARSGRPKVKLLPETDSVFFTPGARGRTIFVRDAVGGVTRMIQRRDGNDVVWQRQEEKPGGSGP